MPTLDRDGVKIHYEVAGDGPALILTHGYSSTGEMWAGQIAPLAEHFKVVTWDMRGHGRSDYPADQALYSECAPHRRRHGRPAGRGGREGRRDRRPVAGRLHEPGVQRHAPGTHPGAADHRHRPRLQERSGPRRLERQRHQARRALRGRRVARPRQGRRGGAPRAPPRRHGPGAWAARGMLTQNNARVFESLPAVGGPAVVIVGADDTPFLAASDYMAAKIPGARKVVIEGARLTAPTSTSQRPSMTPCSASLNEAGLT